MYSDTHFHFRHIVRDRGLDGTALLHELVARNTAFALDIGTEADDLIERHNFVTEAIDLLDVGEQSKALKMVRFAAGIWPSPEEIRERQERVKLLADKIAHFEKSGNRVIAIGECGLDHHWNPSGADNRSKEDFDSSMLLGERELFEMQLVLAKNLELPIVIHSRKAFEDTLDILKNIGYNRGIIHCFSYGIDEARAFLDLGWHIAFGGAVTYAKKTKMDAMKELLRFVPDDRLLLETDAPYLAPVPLRGQTNTPVFIEHVYNFIAEARGINPVALSELVDKNISFLFEL